MMHLWMSPDHWTLTFVVGKLLLMTLAILFGMLLIKKYEPKANKILNTIAIVSVVNIFYLYLLLGNLRAATNFYDPIPLGFHLF